MRSLLSTRLFRLERDATGVALRADKQLAKFERRTVLVILLTLAALVNQCLADPRGDPAGTRALEVLANKVVGAIPLDLLMPGMDGFQVIRHVRQEPNLKGLPILVMTGKSLTSEEIALLSRETQGLLQKDGSWKQQLIAEVGRVVRTNSLAKSAGIS